MEVCPYSYFWWCGYFRGPWVSFASTDEFSDEFSKIASRVVSHELTAYLLVSDLFLTINYYKKRRKPDKFESHNSLKLSFTNIRDLC